MAGGGELVLRHLLVVALRADHGGEQPLVAGEPAAIENPLDQPLREPEHGKGQARVRRVLEIAGVDRLVLPLARERGREDLQLVRAYGEDHRIESPHSPQR